MKEKYGVFIYIVEGEEPFCDYFQNKESALKCAEKYKKMIGDESFFKEARSIEVWEKDEDGLWGNSGEPILRINIGE